MQRKKTAGERIITGRKAPGFPQTVPARNLLPKSITRLPAVPVTRKQVMDI
jgi:hypothetical protein